MRSKLRHEDFDDMDEDEEVDLWDTKTKALNVLFLLIMVFSHTDGFS